MKSVEKLTDRELLLAAREIEAEAKLRANRKAAASAILAILKKHNLSVGDLLHLDLAQRNSTRTKKKTNTKRARLVKAKSATRKNSDKRAQVASKYKNPKSSDKWSGRGRAPEWVSDILSNRGISMAQFKADKRYKV